MKNKTIKLAMFSMLLAQNITIFSVPVDEYRSAGITPVCWKDGNALVLVGKETRDGREVWADFFGGKKSEDGDKPLVTAIRETREETAGVLDLRQSHEVLFWYQSPESSMVNFVCKVDYFEAQTIRDAAQKLREIAKETGEEFYIEKTDWQWKPLQELLDGTTGLELHRVLARKFEDSVMREQFQSLLESSSS